MWPDFAPLAKFKIYWGFIYLHNTWTIWIFFFKQNVLISSCKMQKILLSNLSKFSLLQIGLILKKYSNHLVTLLTTSWRTLRKDFCIWRRVFSRLFKQERELDWWLTWKIDSIRRTENLFFLYGRVQASDWQERSTAVCYDRCLSILTSLKKKFRQLPFRDSALTVKTCSCERKQNVLRRRRRRRSLLSVSRRQFET